MTGLELVFAGLAILTGAAGLLAVTSARVVHCALWLVVSLGSLAGVYLVLGAEIVALVQLLVYVGAVVFLVIFALMLTRNPIAPSRRLDAPAGQRFAAALSGIAVAVLLGGTLVYALGDVTVQVRAGQGSSTAIGTALFAGWVLPFELLSVLLLAALIAALAISRGRTDFGRTAFGRTASGRTDFGRTDGDRSASGRMDGDRTVPGRIDGGRSGQVR